MLRRLQVIRRVPLYVFSGDPLSSTTRSRTAGGGPRRWRCSSRTRWSRSIGRSPGDDRDAPRLLPAGAGPGAGADPLAGRRARGGASIGSATSTSGTRSPFGLLERRVTIPLARRARRLSDGRPAHPPLVPVAAPGEREPPRPAARPLGAAAGIPRPARLPARRQPPLDPLADLGPARRADGQGVRAAERAGPGDPDRPVAAADARSPPSSARPWSRRSRSRRRSAWRPAGSQGGGCSWAGPGRPPGSARARRRSSCFTSCSSSSPCCARRPRGRLAELFDALPPPTLRESLLIVVSTRPVNLVEEAERSRGWPAPRRGPARPGRSCSTPPRATCRPDPVRRARPRATCWSSRPRAPIRSGSTSQERRRSELSPTDDDDEAAEPSRLTPRRKGTGS